MCRVRIKHPYSFQFKSNNNSFEITFVYFREFSTDFDGSVWSHNGPGVLTRVLKRICKTELPDMTPEKCCGFNVLPQNTFYAIKSKQWDMFFNPNLTHKTLKLIRHSVLVHVWNKYSAKKIIRKQGKKSAYDVIASINCPKVYQASYDKF